MPRKIYRSFIGSVTMLIFALAESYSWSISMEMLRLTKIFSINSCQIYPVRLSTLLDSIVFVIRFLEIPFLDKPRERRYETLVKWLIRFRFLFVCSTLIFVDLKNENRFSNGWVIWFDSWFSIGLIRHHHPRWSIDQIVSNNSSMNFTVRVQ